MDELGDAPREHAAHVAVKVCAKSKRAFFDMKRAHGNLRLQLTQRNVGGSLHEAARVLRLVYVNAEENPLITKEETVRYRDDLVRQFVSNIKRSVDQGLHDDRKMHSSPTGAPTVRSPHKNRHECALQSKVPDKLAFQKLAPSWPIHGCGVIDLFARPCQFKGKGTLGWVALGDCILNFKESSLRCHMHIQGTLFNSSDWPSSPDDTSISETMVVEQDEAAKSSRTRGRAIMQKAPTAIAEILGFDDWEKRWCDVASSVDTSVTVGPWGKIDLCPKVFKQTLGWQARRQQGRPAARGKKLKGNGGLSCGFNWNDEEFVAPCQLHIWLTVQSSRHWLHHDSDKLESEIEQELSSEDEAEQAELEIALDDMSLQQDRIVASEEEIRKIEDGDLEVISGKAHGIIDGSDVESAESIVKQRPKFRVFRARDRQSTSSTHHYNPTRAEISLWHRWFKSMNANTFFEKVQGDPNLLDKYTKHATRLEAFDAPEDRVVERVACILEALPNSRRGSPLKILDLGSGEGCLASRLQARQESPSSIHFEITNVDAFPFTQTTEVHNLAALPQSWSGRFDVVVLSRSLWARDYRRVLHEAKRVLVVNHSSLIVICEPFRRWWGRDKRRPDKNALPWMVERCGFSIEWNSTVGTEPFATSEEHNSSAIVQHALFQYIVGRLEPSRCVLCKRLPACTFPRGLRLCLNCEESDAGMRPVRECLQATDWRPQWAVEWAHELSGEEFRARRAARDVSLQCRKPWSRSRSDGDDLYKYRHRRRWSRTRSHGNDRFERFRTHLSARACDHRRRSRSRYRKYLSHQRS